MSHVLATTAALAIAFATVPTPKPTPFPLGTLQPFGTETPAPAPSSVLPEIGRVRAASPSCAAMRDLVIPSFAAALRADARFTQTRARLPQYVDYIDDPEHSTDVFRESALSKLDQDATAILGETLLINKALGDPRFKNPTDPVVAAEKAQLEQLYNTQQARANQLQEFVTRQRVAIAKNNIDDTSAFTGNRRQQGRDAAPPPAPIPNFTAPPGMPVLGGRIAMADKAAINDWSGAIAAAIRASENRAARTFLPIAHSCR